MKKDTAGKAAFVADGKRVTLKSLASHLGLSISTISRGLKGAPDIGADTIALIRKAALEVGYTPDLRGVKLRTGQTFTLVYLKAIHQLQDVPDGAVVAQIDAITSFLQNTPYQLQIVPWHPAQDDPLAILTRIVSGRLADGILLDMTQPQDKRVLYLLENGFPSSPLAERNCSPSIRTLTPTVNRRPTMPPVICWRADGNASPSPVRSKPTPSTCSAGAVICARWPRLASLPISC